MNNQKEEFLRKFNEAFLVNDIPFILDSITDDVHWEMVGDVTFKGKVKVKEFFESMDQNAGLETLKIQHIITHGKFGSANGTMKMKDKSGDLVQYGFCDVYEFSGFKNPKIKTLTSYVVKKINES